MVRCLHWRRLRALALFAPCALLITACSGDSLPPSGVGTLPHAITFGRDTLVVAPGSTTHLTPHIGSAPVTAELTWSTTNAGVAQISPTNDVIAVAPGITTITASTTTSTGLTQGTLVVRVADTVRLGEFRSPLAQSVPVVSVFDHDLPFEFADTNGYLLSFWNEKLSGIDGHNGYDWPVPTGTPILAAAAGVVTYAQLETPFVCPLLGNATVAGMWVMVAHGLSTGQAVVTEYGHLSRIDVHYGQRVGAGQQLGLSGSTGCSTGPHLHFSAFAGSPADARAPIVMDPYGWQSTAPDPWAQARVGTASTALWSPANAPPIYREYRSSGSLGTTAPVVIARVHYMGVDDDHNPNNEFIEVTANPSVGDAVLTGITLVDNRGERFAFPSGSILPAGQSLRVFSGSGTNSATALYWGRTAPAWDDIADCARLFDANGVLLFQFSWFTTCGSSANRAAAVPMRAMDVESPMAGERLRVRPRPD